MLQHFSPIFTAAAVVVVVVVVVVVQSTQHLVVREQIAERIDQLQ